MDWDLAIKLNSELLRETVETLFALLGIVGEATVSRILRSLYSAVLGVLRPAESALRRLIVIAARGVVVKLAPSRPMPKGHMIGKGEGSRPSSFQLFDPRKNFPELRQRRVKYAKHPPRILFFGDDSRVDALWPAPQPVATPISPPSDGLINAARLSRRLQALKLALDDLPRQARRLVRLRARREKVPSLRFKSPIRPGHAPGHRKKPTHEVDEILANCHWLAWEALKPETS